MVSCHFFDVIMNQQLSDQLIEMLLKSIEEEEDKILLQKLDYSLTPATKLICSIRLSEDKVISIERIESANLYFFILRNRRKHQVIERRQVENIFDGVEYFMSQLNECDSDKLWRWYLKNGDADEHSGTCNDSGK